MSLPIQVGAMYVNSHLVTESEESEFAMCVFVKFYRTKGGSCFNRPQTDAVVNRNHLFESETFNL